ncbi:MAG: DotU family type VI secretion system protein [Aquabacterium sp.]|nr:DotU family type VI secretion system protein [Aquabacterium sp.]
MTQPPTHTPVDPFASIDTGRTFVMPTPGVRPTSTSSPFDNLARGADVAADLSAPDTGLNPLVALANPLLALVPQIRTTTHLADATALKEAMSAGLRDFEAKARAAGIASERILAARYILCTLLDETAASTPWGGSGQWARHNLLVTFHNEAYGGEKVFQLMAKLAEDANTNRDLLEVIYAVLTMGFEGRYRVIEGGKAQLETVRERLAQILKKARGDYSPVLAQNWHGAPQARRIMLSWLPLWVTGAVTALLLLALYFGLTFALSAHSDPVFGQIQSLRLAPPVPPVAIPAAKPRLAQFLQADVRSGLVAVRDEIDRSVITLRGDGLFEAGSAALSDNREAIMKRIAQALVQVPGTVLITGHTDNQPIRSMRFPSNWHLSQERADTVRDLLQSHGVVKERVRSEGRADGEPVVDNTTPNNRAVNRRVEVILFVARDSTKDSAQESQP